MWNGLRVRMAVHYGVPNCDLDRSTGRMTYVRYQTCFAFCRSNTFFNSLVRQSTK